MTNERTVADYFLRYTATFPEMGVIDRQHHKTFDSECFCGPQTTFDDQNGWHTIVHKAADPPPQAEGQGEVCKCGHGTDYHNSFGHTAAVAECAKIGCPCSKFQPPSVEDKSKAAE